MHKYAVITMDVEDWYHTYFPELDVDRSQSLLDGLDVALSIMDGQNIKGSFFVVGEIADKLSDKIRKMQERFIQIREYYNLSVCGLRRTKRYVTTYAVKRVGISAEAYSEK